MIDGAQAPAPKGRLACLYGLRLSASFPWVAQLSMRWHKWRGLSAEPQLGPEGALALGRRIANSAIASSPRSKGCLNYIRCHLS